MLGSLGWEELLVILVILALLFGASRVSELGGALGRGIREFRAEAGRPATPEPGTPESTAAAEIESPQQPDNADLLANLEKLHAEGVLNDEEFATKSAALGARTGE